MQHQNPRSVFLETQRNSSILFFVVLIQPSYNEKQKQKQQLLTGAQSGSWGVQWTSHWRMSAQRCRWHASAASPRALPRLLLHPWVRDWTGPPKWTSGFQDTCRQHIQTGHSHQDVEGLGHPGLKKKEKKRLSTHLQTTGPFTLKPRSSPRLAPFRLGEGWCIYIYSLDQTCIRSFTSLFLQTHHLLAVLNN